MKKENKQHFTEQGVRDEAVASVLQLNLEGRIQPVLCEEFSSTSPWGRFAKAAIQCPRSHKQCDFHKDLQKATTD